MIELVSACSEMRLPVGATTSKASSIAPVEGEGMLAEGVAHIELEADDAALDQRRHVVDGVFAEQTVKAEIDIGLCGGDGVLVGQHFGGAGRRNGVRHVEHGGDAAERRRRGAARQVFLVRIAGIAEMHVNVDRAGQDMQARRVEAFLRAGGIASAAPTARTRPSLMATLAAIARVGRHHRAVVDDEIGCASRSCAIALTALPSRRRPADRRR